MDFRPDRDQPVGATTPDALSDEQLGALVRSVASRWSMPARGLHEVPWHDRVGRGSQTTGLRRGGIAGWMGALATRLAAAATLAVAGSVVLALVAVSLRAPVAGPEPTGPSGSLPAIIGEPMPGRFIAVQGLDGAGPLDLGSGRFRPDVAGGAERSESMLVSPDGTMVCICGWVPDESDDARSRVISVRRFKSDGTLVRDIQLSGPAATLRGPAPGSGDLDAVAGDLAADGTTLFVGWSTRSTEAWRIGLQVVDLATGVKLQSVALPDVPIPAGVSVVVGAPRVAVSPDGTRLAIRVESSTDEEPQPLRRWSATFQERRVAEVGPLPGGPGTLADAGCAWAVEEAFATDDSYYALCLPGDMDLGRLVLRRVRPDGAPLGDTKLSGLAPHGLWGTGYAVDRAAGTWYAWSPFGRMLVKVSLRTGAVVASKQLSLDAAGGGWLEGIRLSIGRWLAPSTLAKTEMAPSLAISPDGSRLYALAVGGDSPAVEVVPPAGILVVDAATLDMLDQWAPTADYGSMGLSADGAWLYALGLPRADAQGRPDASTIASLTVHGTSDGAVRLRIEGFGGSTYRFPTAVVP